MLASTTAARDDGATAAKAVAAAAADNDENACPNRRQPEGRRKAAATLCDRRRRSSRRSMGPRVARLAALFDDDADEGRRSIGDGDDERGSSSHLLKPHRTPCYTNGKNSPTARRSLVSDVDKNSSRKNAPTSPANDSRMQRERERRRRHLLQERRSPRRPELCPSLSISSVKDCDVGFDGSSPNRLDCGSERQVTKTNEASESNLETTLVGKKEAQTHANDSSDGPPLKTLAADAVPGNNGSGESKSFQANDENVKRDRDRRRRLLLEEWRSPKRPERRPSFTIGSIKGSNIRVDEGASDRILLESSQSSRLDCGSERRLAKNDASDSKGETLSEATLVRTTKGKAPEDDETLNSLAANAIVTVINAESQDSSCHFQSGQSPPRVLASVSRLILFVLALFEVRHHCFFSPTATVFGVILDVTGWSGVLHVAFVIAFFIRSLVLSVPTARGRRGRSSKIDEDTCGDSSRLQTTLLFLFVASCWMALLPAFKDCESEANTAYTSHFCFFAKRSSSLGKGKARHEILAISSPRYSLMDLLSRKWYSKTKAFIKSKIKGRLMREIKRGLWRPFMFHERLKKLFLVLRWAKFLAPLVGTCNKLRGHVLDAIKKRRQHIASKRAHKRWNELLDRLSKRSKSERAVLELQKRFRERREAKAKRRFALMTRERNGKGHMARRIRRRLAEEQESSRSKLEKMEALEGQRRRRRQVSADERRGIARHKESERRLKKRLLLSPKTSFAVGWKFLTVTCVVLEMLQIAFAPVLSGEMRKMPLDEFLLRVFNAQSPSRCQGDVKKSAAAAIPSLFVPVINDIGDFACTNSSWKQIWLAAADVIATLLVPIVNTIFFLDVFITFFTGELASSGTLVPKPPFTRYILPGIGLQLIVNPTMIEISQMVKRSIVHAVRIGPSLCFHLLLVCIPFVVYCHDCLLDIIMDFVERQNKIVATR